jgi:hypothetical protein
LAHDSDRNFCLAATRRIDEGEEVTIDYLWEEGAAVGVMGEQTGAAPSFPHFLFIWSIYIGL